MNGEVQTEVAVSASAMTDKSEIITDFDEGTKSEKIFTSGSIPSKAYNPFPYITRGIFIPFGYYNTDVPHSKDAKEESPVTEDATLIDQLLNSYFVGGTYITANPWTDGGSDLFQLTAGWNPASNCVGTAFTAVKGTSTSLFQTQTQIKSEFNSDGWKQGGIISVISSGFEVGRMSSILISNTAKGLFFINDMNLSLTDVISVQYSNIRRAGPGRFERAGFGVALSYGYSYDIYFGETSNEYQDVSALGGIFKLCIPHLMQFESKYGFTYNLPVTLDFRLLPSSSNYAYVYFGESADNEKDAIKKLGNVVFDGAVEATVFSMDIQRAIPWLTAIYLNDFYADLGYAAVGTAGSASETGFQTAKLGEYFTAMADGRGYYLDSVYLKAGLEFTPNIGTFAKPTAKMGAYAIYSYTIRSVKELKPDERIKLSIGFNMNF